MPLRVARHSRWPAAAIPWRPSRNTTSKTGFPTFPPAAARSSNSSRVRRSPRWRCWRKGPRVSAVLRRTKIVATVGPATDDISVLTEMMRAGLGVVRLNASHGTVDDRRRRLALVRDAANRADKCIGVLLDLGGPKIRIEGFRTGKVVLQEGQAFALDMELDSKSGTSEVVGVAYKDLPKD